jgi:23S rRNA (cytidine1920-2'-O)/16S rRNA (cytidine1409-2'-O)-methyltransferase
VFAIDVGHGILHWKLRQDPRVTVMERTNVRYLAALEVPIQVATIDVAFISLRLVLPVVVRWLEPRGDVVALVKPQFEAGREAVGKGGVVRNSAVHRAVLRSVAEASQEVGLGVQGIVRSPLRGPKGNVEFFLWAIKGVESRAGYEVRIDDVVSSQVSPTRHPSKADG